MLLVINKHLDTGIYYW